MSEVEFKKWPSIPRGQDESISITEKLDGTNACIVINEDCQIISVQSRKRIIGIHDDNYGFAQWVANNYVDLQSMGQGYHYGEWAGPGIRKNRHRLPEKKFFLFNTFRWNPNNPNKPKCCRVVPLLYEGESGPFVVQNTMQDLKDTYINYNVENNETTKPEGVVVWFHRGQRYEKHTFEHSKGKWTEK